MAPRARPAGWTTSSPLIRCERHASQISRPSPSPPVSRSIPPSPPSPPHTPPPPPPSSPAHPSPPALPNYVQAAIMSAQMAELSALVGGDENAPQFLQEMLVLQMQAEGWRVQWSVAMQENEELRAQLYDTHNSLAAKGGEGASEEHWRELCMRSRSQRTMRRRVGSESPDSRWSSQLYARTPPLPRKATMLSSCQIPRGPRASARGGRGPPRREERMAAETEAGRRRRSGAKSATA